MEGTSAEDKSFFHIQIFVASVEVVVVICATTILRQMQVGKVGKSDESNKNWWILKFPERYGETGKIDLFKLKTELKCSKKSFASIAKIFLISSVPSLFDLVMDNINAYTYFTGKHYTKIVANDTDASITPGYMNSTKNCTLIGERQNYVTNEKYYVYECFEIDQIWGMLTLLFVYAPGLMIMSRILPLMTSESFVKHIVCPLRWVLFILTPINFPIQLLIVKLIHPFAGEEWSKMGSLYSAVEAGIEGSAQLILQLFIIFTRMDRYPSTIQWISIGSSLLGFVMALFPQHDVALEKKVSHGLYLLPFFFVRIVTAALSITMLRFSYLLLPLLYLFLYQRPFFLIFTLLTEAITLIVLLIGVNRFPEAEWLLTGYPSMMAKPSTFEITKERELNFFLFSLNISWFNFITIILIVVAIVTWIYRWWTNSWVKAFDHDANTHRGWIWKKHLEEEGDLEADMLQVSIEGGKLEKKQDCNYRTCAFSSQPVIESDPP